MRTVQPKAQKGKHTKVEGVPFRKVTAIVRASVLEEVEQRLHDLQVPGISVTKVKGYGECANFFARDWLVEHARIEVFLTSDRATEIARAIMEAAHTGIPGDGIVVVLPVESVYHVRTRRLATADELRGKRHDDAETSGKGKEVEP